MLSTHSFAANYQLLFLYLQKSMNDFKNVFMSKSLQNNVLCVRWLPYQRACIPKELTIDCHLKIILYINIETFYLTVFSV